MEFGSSGDRRAVCSSSLNFNEQIEGEPLIRRRTLSMNKDITTTGIKEARAVAR
jgi:hypothetical protein